jgi:hypothetical protein
MRLKNAMIRVFGMTALIFTTLTGIAQTGEIIGTIQDEKGEILPFTPIVTLFSGDQKVITVETDGNGKFVIKPVAPGAYDVLITQVGMKSQKQTNVIVGGDKTSFLKVVLKEDVTMVGSIDVFPHYQSMVSLTMTVGKMIDAEEIKHFGGERNMVGLISGMVPTVTPTDDGKDVYIRGSRRGATGYVVDDMRVLGSFDVPTLSVQGVTVYTGGLPAMYGDVTGGLVVISTKSYFSGLSQKNAMRNKIIDNQQ